MTAPIQLTNEQFQQLLQAAMTGPVAPPGGAGMVTGAASLVGEMPRCNMGKDKLKRFKRWKDWLQDAENKMRFLNMRDERQKLDFLRSCAGPELTEFWEKEARVRFTQVGIDRAHMYDEVIQETKTALLKFVSKDRALIELLRIDQGNRNFMEFVSEIEEQEDLCRIDEQPITGEDLKRISLIAGMRDRTLAEKALAEEHSLTEIIKAGITREASKVNVEAMRATPSTSINRMTEAEPDIQRQIEDLRSEVDVMRLQQSGKYSRRYKPPEENNSRSCDTCTYNHTGRRCPAEGKACNECKEIGHFAKSRVCKMRYKHTSTTRRLQEHVETDSNNSDEEDREYTMARVEHSWPGVQKGTTKTREMYTVQSEDREVYAVQVKKTKQQSKSKIVTIDVGGKQMQLYCDTGSRFTIIPPQLYTKKMGAIQAADCHLRAWGASTKLDTKGMFKTRLTTAQGASTETMVYVVAGTRPEPLLGATDAESLGIISFRPEGRPATRTELKECINPGKSEVRKISAENSTYKNKCSTSKLRDAGVPVHAEKAIEQNESRPDRRAALEIVRRYTGSVMTDRIGEMKISPIHLQYETDFKPTQPPQYPIPHHYRERTALHIDKLRREGIIEDVDPAEPIDCVLNTTISEKKAAGSIRMNIDARPINVGAKHTKYHVATPQEVRHELKGARVFTELDMVCGFHQVPLAPESQIVFQTHCGLHRMKRLFFGPKNSSGIFHHEVQKVFKSIPNVLSIHDNVLIYAPDVETHNKALEATMKKAKEMNITFKTKEATICEPSVKWFGRVYMAAGVTSDPDKIQIISKAGRPENIQDVKSLLQAAAYNAKFVFDHQEDMSYEEATAPLRQLITKNAVFSWNDEREQAYQVIVKMLTDRSILAPFKIGRQTHLVTDASPEGISATIYQVDEAGRWLPVDHASRAMSRHERAWDSQIEWESLSKMWGMSTFRPYLIGCKFKSWGDHKPLVPLYNDFKKAATQRISKHRTKVSDLSFTDHYLPGTRMPADYFSRHPAPIDNLTQQQREADLIDDGDDVMVMRVILDDTPPVLTLDKLQQGAARDPAYQRLKNSISARKGEAPAANDPELSRYRAVWNELSIIQDLVCKGEKIVVPDSRLEGEEITLREWVVDLGHSGHMGMSATKRLLRHRLWFPGMDKMIEDRIYACIACQAATDKHSKDPLKPNEAPKEPWSVVYADHWGPTPDHRHILVIIDALTRYPEVITVKSTSAEDNIHGFAEAFSRHGVPHIMRSDNGPPFNGKDTHLLQRWLAKIGVQHRPNISAQDPEASGQVEAFMKHLKKVFHTATVEGTDPYMKLQEHLMLFRGTPHPTTGKCPAELLFGRTFRTNIPDIRTNPATKRRDIIEARAEDSRKKAAMKEKVDKKTNIRPHNIQVGDQVLLKQKSSKQNPVYDPKPYTVTNVWGTQIQGTREDTSKTRDAQRWKFVMTKKHAKYRTFEEESSTYLSNPDIGYPVGQYSYSQHSPRQPPRSPDTEQERGSPTDAIPAQVMRQLYQHPDVIMPATTANRTSRLRSRPDRYKP